MIEVNGAFYVRNAAFCSRPASIRFWVSIFRNFTSILISFSRSLSLIPSNSDFLGLRQHGELNEFLAINVQHLGFIEFEPHFPLRHLYFHDLHAVRMFRGHITSDFGWSVSWLNNTRITYHKMAMQTMTSVVITPK